MSLWIRPLRLHLSLVICLLLIGTAVPVMWLNYEQGKRAALAAAEQRMSLLSQHAIDRYKSVFGDGYSVATMASALDALRSKPEDDLGAKTDFLIKAVEGSPYIDGLYVGYPDGSFLHVVGLERNPRWIEAIDAPAGSVFAVRTIDRSGLDAISTWRFLDRQNQVLEERTTDEVQYDPRRRPWYRAAARNGPATVGPYVTATTRSLALTVAVPMAEDESIVIGVDVMLEAISRLLAEESISANSRGFVFGAENRLIVHSDKAMMDQILSTYSTAPREGTPTPAADPALEAIKRQIRGTAGGEGRTVRFEAEGVPYLAHISSVGFSDLLRDNTVVIAAPLEDFTGPAARLLTKNLLIAGTMLVAGLLVALLASRLISKSLLALAQDARHIGNLEFEEHARGVSWIAEINTVADALASAREAIRTFALYVPRELVRRIVTAGQTAAGKAARQDVTVLFTDIRDFTTISEQHAPEDVVGMLSSYFELMNGIVERHNGVIIQYLGDSIFAMWNAPETDPAHVEDACRCALELKAAIDGLNEANRASGRPELVTRFGVHTGIAVVGSVGAEARRQYTAMGDTVNVASRLEGMNKQFGTTILVSGQVRALSGSRFTFRALGSAQAKGRSEEIEIFELTGAGPPA